MQIKGSTLSTAFTPRSSEVREPVRPPVIIDAEPWSRNARSLLPAATETSRFQTALTIDDGQDERQARFVRLFADNNQSENIRFCCRRGAASWRAAVFTNRQFRYRAATKVI